MDITPVSQAQQALLNATTPRQSKAVESMASAAKAWAKEQNDYEMFVAAAHIYIMARRKTTELMQPDILHGSTDGYGNRDVTLADYGFTKMQWHRRVKELSIPPSEIDEYFDQCIAMRWEPTLFGLWKWKENPHVAYNSGENEWYTPPEFIISAREVMGEIDLDPASTQKANKIVGAKKIYTEETDGLDEKNSWSGKVWMNPPYDGKLIKLFASRYADNVKNGNITEGIVLVNNATETGWFAELVSVSAAVVFTFNRVKFLDPQGNPGAPLQGQALLYSGNNEVKFLQEYSKFGWGAKLC